MKLLDDGIFKVWTSKKYEFSKSCTKSYKKGKGMIKNIVIIFAKNEIK